MFVDGVHTAVIASRATKMCKNALILAQNLRRIAVGLYIKKGNITSLQVLALLPISFPTSLLFLNSMYLLS